MFRRLARLVGLAFAALAIVMTVVPVSATQYAFSVYTPEEGLAATAVFRIDQDEKGHLWFATSEGVSRFDGVEFRNFDVSTGLPDQRVYSMVRDREGRFWFGHSDGVSLFDGRILRNYTHEDGVARGVAWAATLDRFGNPWFGTQNGGVSVWTGSGFRSYGVESGLPEEFVYGLFADSKDRLWIGTRSEGIAIAEIDAEGGLEIVRTYSTEQLSARGVREFREDVDGNIYATTRGNGVFQFDGESLDVSAHLMKGVDVYTMIVTSANELVVGRSFGGLEFFALPDLRPRLTIGEAEGLPPEIFSLFEDREGGIWIGSGIGVLRWPGEAITNYDRRDGIVGTFVLGVSVAGESSVWVASAQGASLLEVDPERPGRFSIRNLTRAEGLPSEEVWQVLRDRQDRLWIATADGLCLYREGVGCRLWTKADGLPSDYISVLIERSEGGLWVGAAGGVAGLVLDEATGVARIVPIEGHLSLDAANVYALAEIGEALWIATDAGLFVRTNGAMSALGPANGLPRRGVNDILVDARGDLWVATSGLGVGYGGPAGSAGPGTTFAMSGHAAGLPSNTVLSLVEGDDDTLWAGTGAGVAQIDARRVRKGALHVVRRQLTSASGLLGSEPGSGGAFCRSSDGVYWFGLARGVSRYDPSLERGSDVAPTVEIGRVIANREAIWVAPFDSMSASEGAPAADRRDAVLTHKTSDLTFEFRGLSFQDPSRVTYQTKLEGLDDEWSRPSRSRVKEYTHLPPGKYMFRVRAISAAGLQSLDDASYPVTIHPPFWATDWFPPLVLVSLALLVAFIVLLRSRRVKLHNIELAEVVATRTSDLELRTRELELANKRIVESEKTKSRFLAGMSHELRTPLNSIIGFTELMLSVKEKGSREAKFLGNVHHSAHQLLAQINDLLDLSKIDAGKMEVFIDYVALPPLVDTVLSTLEPLSKPRRVAVERVIPDNLPVVQLDGNKVRQILYNLLSNAIRFSPAGSGIRVEIRDLAPDSSPLATESVVIEVFDRGIGIPPEEIQTIFEEYHQSPTVSKLGLATGLGLAIVRKFAELQGGTVQVEPNDDGGSTFRVWLPQNAIEFETDSGPHSTLTE